MPFRYNGAAGERQEKKLLALLCRSSSKMPCEQVPLQDPAVIIKLLPDGLDEVEQILRLSDIFAVGHLHGVFRHIV